MSLILLLLLWLIEGIVSWLQVCLGIELWKLLQCVIIPLVSWLLLGLVLWILWLRVRNQVLHCALGIDEIVGDSDLRTHQVSINVILCVALFLRLWFVIK